MNALFITVAATLVASISGFSVPLRQDPETICASQADFLRIPSATSCQHYFQCYADRAYSMQCPEGMWFNDDRQLCDDSTPPQGCDVEEEVDPEPPEEIPEVPEEEEEEENPEEEIPEEEIPEEENPEEEEDNQEGGGNEEDGGNEVDEGDQDDNLEDNLEEGEGANEEDGEEEAQIPDNNLEKSLEGPSDGDIEDGDNEDGDNEDGDNGDGDNEDGDNEDGDNEDQSNELPVPGGSYESDEIASGDLTSTEESEEVDIPEIQRQFEMLKLKMRQSAVLHYLKM